MAGPTPEPTLWLGTGRGERSAAVELPVRALLRHAIALGSSGSGKTVFCKVVVEEAVRRGVPVIAIDPQGDLASLALGPVADGELAAHGGDAGVAAELREKADVVVFTPASHKGVALCADPVNADAASLAPDERTHAVTRTASRITALLGYDLDSDEGTGVRAVLDRCMTELIDAGLPARNLSSLMEHLAGLGDGIDRYARYLDPKKIRAAIRRAARLDVGARRLLFHDGLPIDIDVLLGRSGPGATPPGKTRVAVIYLSTLHAQEDKEFIVAALADRLYSWMLRNPSPELQALFYLDEVAPFIPPVEKPACKEDLELLFKQGRKFGIGCLIATQNPGDVDYKALSQFGTWVIGRLATRQDLKKVEPALRSVAGAATEAVLEALPGLKPGELVALSPDHFAAPCALATRRLVTAHHTLDEAAVERLAKVRWHDRFAIPRPAVRGSIALDPTLPAAASAPASPSTKRARDVRAPAAVAAPVSVAAPAPAPATAPGDRIAAILGGRVAMTVDEVARKAAISAGKARELLKLLVAAERAGAFRDGRSIKYWSRASGARPDLGMKARIASVRPLVDRAAAEAIAQSLVRSKLLGIIGENEVFEHAQLEYRVVYRVMFEERVKKGLLARMVGSSHEERLGSVYLHARTLGVLEYSAAGIRFATEIPEHASEIQDLDGAAQLEEVRPADIVFDEDEWHGRREPAEAKQQVRRLFGARPGAVEPIMVPLWRLVLRRGAGESFRVVMIDALAGRVLEWPSG
jgi:hypothetical protein